MTLRFPEVRFDTAEVTTTLLYPCRSQLQINGTPWNHISTCSPDYTLGNGANRGWEVDS